MTFYHLRALINGVTVYRTNRGTWSANFAEREKYDYAHARAYQGTVRAIENVRATIVEEK